MYTSKYRVEDKSDVTIIQNAITVSSLGDVQENMKNAMNYITFKGLKLEKIPYANHVSEFKSLENTDSEIVAQIKEGLKQVYIWKITVDESVNVYADARTESFNVDTSIDGKGLSSYCQEI